MSQENPPVNDKFNKLYEIVENLDISDGAIRLLTRLIALSKKEGYVFATNEHLAKKHKRNPRTIGRWLSELEKKGFIRIELNPRKIYICDQLKHQIGNPSLNKHHNEPNNRSIAARKRVMKQTVKIEILEKENDELKNENKLLKRENAKLKELYRKDNIIHIDFKKSKKIKPINPTNKE